MQKNLFKKKELIILTGITGGIGNFVFDNLPDEYEFLILGRSKKKLKDLAEKKKRVVYHVYNQKKNFDNNQFEKKIKFKNYTNIHLVFFSGVLDEKKTYFDYKNWLEIFQINLISHLEILFSIIHFYKKKNKTVNQVIFLSGGGGASSLPEFPAYSASKTAIVRTVENLSKKYSKLNFSIFALAPGAIKTKMLSKVLKYSKVRKRSSKKRVLEFIIRCLEDKNKIYNGKLIHVRDKLRDIIKNKNKDSYKLRRIT